MAGPSFFNLKFTHQIQKESWENYYEQLAAKKSHLTAAQQQYQASQKVVDEIQQNLAAKLKELSEVQKNLEKSTDSKTQIKLHKKKEALEQFIDQYTQKLEPYIMRIGNLAQNISNLEDQMRVLENLDAGSGHIPAQGA